MSGERGIGSVLVETGVDLGRLALEQAVDVLEDLGLGDRVWVEVPRRPGAEKGF
jgi:hypothetical protein